MLFIALLGLMAVSFSACKKNKCEECHYDKAGAEIELGEKCGDEMEVQHLWLAGSYVYFFLHNTQLIPVCLLCVILLIKQLMHVLCPQLGITQSVSPNML